MCCPGYPLFGVTPILLPVAAAAVAVLEGAAGGAGFALWIGLIWTLSYPGVPAAMIFLLTLSGLLVGTLSQYALRSSFVGCMVCSAACLALLELFQVASGVIVQLGPLYALLSTAFREWLLSLLDPGGVPDLLPHLPPGGRTAAGLTVFP